MCFNGYALRKQPKRGIEFNLGLIFSRPGLHSVSRALFGTRPEIGDISSKGNDHIRVSIHEKGASCSRLTPQCVHSPVVQRARKKKEKVRFIIAV